MKNKTIPFNRPANLGLSYENIRSSLKSGHLCGRGPHTVDSEHWLEQRFPAIDRALLTTSCTHALEASAILMSLQPGDEVIVPSFTFVTSALAFKMHGATIKFCDIRPDTLNIDEKLLEAQVTERTRAIVIVHYAGVACELDSILRIAQKHNLFLIEDNAHGIFGKYKGKELGTFGDFSTLSFHETKNISCGEGGALLVNNREFSEKAEIVIEKGTDRAKFINGQVDKYSWVDDGSSYVMSDLLAGLLLAQLQNSEKIQEKRKKVWNFITLD